MAPPEVADTVAETLSAVTVFSSAELPADVPVDAEIPADVPADAELPVVVPVSELPHAAMEPISAKLTIKIKNLVVNFLCITSSPFFFLCMAVLYTVNLKRN